MKEPYCDFLCDMCMMQYGLCQGISSKTNIIL